LKEMYGLDRTLFGLSGVDGEMVIHCVSWI